MGLPTAAQLCYVAVHIGKKVKTVFDAYRPKLTVTAFAKEIGRSRKNIYEIFQQPTCDTGLLRKISKALHHDFFQYLEGATSEAGSMLAEPVSGYGRSRQVDSQPLQLTLNFDPNDPEAQEKMARILKIMRGE